MPSLASCTTRLEPTRLQLDNNSDQHAGHAGHDGSGESHFALVIESAAFEGLNRVQRQRLVFRAVGDLMERRVHALQIQAVAPGEGAFRTWGGPSLSAKGKSMTGRPTRESAWARTPAVPFG